MDKKSTNSFSNHANIAIEKRFNALAMATSDVIYSLSADWEIMYELDGRGFLLDSDRPITGWKEINVFAEDMEIVNKTIAEAIEQKKIFALEHRVNRADGSTGWTFSRAIPILGNDGEILEWLGTATDITDRKETEFALTKSQAVEIEQKKLYETITSGTPDLMYVFDLDYKFTYANEALLAMWGKTAEQAIGKGLLDNGYEPWHAKMHEREIDQIVATGKPIRGEVSFPHAELGKRIYDYILNPVFGSNGEVIAVSGTTRDVTDLRHAMEALQHTSEELQTTNEELASSNEELIVANEQLLMLNEQLLMARKQISDAETVLRQAIAAANFGTWFIHPETKKFITDARVKQLLGYYADEEPTLDEALERVSEDYRSKVAEKLENAIYNNGDYDVTCPVIGLHDKKLRWVRAVGNLTVDGPGSISVFTGLLMDITEQKNDEIRKSDFIAMVSHELKTPLTSMKGYVQVVLRKLKSSGDEMASAAMEKANQQVEKMTIMINGFLNLSRLESGKISINHALFDLADLIRNVKEEIDVAVSSHEIIFAPTESAMINGDQDKIAQVIHNLISNAVKYSPINSTINVACINNDENALITVTDRGMGIAQQDLHRVFERYFRAEDTKMAAISGFGIGLYICKEIISLHEGKIWAESSADKGTIFAFTLPIQK